jgi:hypothetical protein
MKVLAKEMKDIGKDAKDRVFVRRLLLSLKCIFKG